MDVAIPFFLFFHLKIFNFHKLIILFANSNTSTTKANGAEIEIFTRIFNILKF